MMTYDIRLTDKEEIKAGDIILCEDGKIRTVCNNNITRGFTGICIFGNSYRLGLEKVKKIINLKI